MTEHPTVVDGFVDVYQQWIDLGIDGFRIDTAKHVNFEFWEEWSTEVLDYAHDVAGQARLLHVRRGLRRRPGQALALRARHRHELGARLHVPVRGRRASRRATRATGLQDLFAGDDHYTTPDSSATALPTFLGNHDMGRVGYFLAGDR